MNVRLLSANLPSAVRVNALLVSHAVDLQMDGADLMTHSGFWPGRLEGQLTGFEYYLHLADDDAQRIELTLRFSLDHEAAAALFVAWAIALEAGGVVLDPQSGATLEEASVLEAARLALANVARPFRYPN